MGNHQTGRNRQAAGSATPLERLSRLREETDGQHWMKVLAAVLREFGMEHAKRDKDIGFMTFAARRNALFLCFHQLKEEGFNPIPNPLNLSEKHIKALVSRWERENLAAATVQSRLSTLRTYCRWILRDGLIPATEALVTKPETARRTYAAARDKSWSANGIDVDAVIADLKKQGEEAPAIWIRLCAAFGLRRQEAVLLDFRLMRQDGWLSVLRGTKGGRPREVPIETDYQRAAFAEGREFFIRNGNSLIPKEMTLRQAIDKISNLMKKHGITKNGAGTTLHGLRAQYACDTLETLGYTPPVRGAESNAEPKSRAARDAATLAVMERLGHSRTNIGSAYYGKDPAGPPA